MTNGIHDNKKFKTKVSRFCNQISLSLVLKWCHIKFITEVSWSTNLQSTLLQKLCYVTFFWNFVWRDIPDSNFYQFPVFIRVSAVIIKIAIKVCYIHSKATMKPVLQNIGQFLSLSNVLILFSSLLQICATLKISN